jgi:hypothetical protein
MSDDHPITVTPNPHRIRVVTQITSKVARTRPSGSA